MSTSDVHVSNKGPLSAMQISLRNVINDLTSNTPRDCFWIHANTLKEGMTLYSRKLWVKNSSLVLIKTPSYEKDNSEYRQVVLLLKIALVLHSANG